MQDVAPLRSRNKMDAPPPSSIQKRQQSEVMSADKVDALYRQPAMSVLVRDRGAASPPKILHKLHTPKVGVRVPGLDNTQWRRLSRGQMSVDAKLDLHGYIVQDAFEAFLQFMRRSRGMGWRCVEIVTGLGSGARGGMIRKELPLWLQRGDIAPMVLGVVHSHRGNQGALRLLLRKKR